MGIQPETIRIVYIAADQNFTIAADLISQGDVFCQFRKIHVIVQRQCTAALVIGHHTGRPIHVLELQQTGVGAAVGKNKAIHTEISVMRPFTVVSTVVEDGTAILRFPFIDSVIAPFPEETADKTAVALDHLKVILQISGTVAHTMAVFAHQVGFVRSVVQILLNAFQRRVHIAVQIDVGKIVFPLFAAVLRAFIMGQPAGVKLLCPCQRFLKSAAVGTLVSHGPDDDTGAVFVPFNTTAGAIYGGLGEFGIVRNRLVPMFNVHIPALIFAAIEFGRTVTFVVGLINDEETVLIAKLVEIGNIRIVAGADRIEIVSLDHFKITLRLGKTNGIPGDGVGLMAIDAVKFDGQAVDKHLIVRNTNFPQTNAVGDGLTGCFQNNGVKVRLLCVPENRILHSNDCLIRISGIAAVSFRQDGADQFTFSAVDRDAGRCWQISVAQPDVDLCIAMGKNSGDEIILNALFGTAEKIHITEDTVHAEHILIFHIAAVTPFQNQNGQMIGAVVEQTGYIELAARVGNLTVPHIIAVEPDIKAGSNALKVQKRTGRNFILMIDKITDVRTTGIVFRNIRRVCRERITDICILVMVVAVILPDARHRGRIVIG